MNENGDEVYSIVSSARWLPLRKRLSFCRITDAYDYSKYFDSKVPIRDFHLVEFAKGMTATFVDQIRQQAIASGQDAARVDRALKDLLPIWDDSRDRR